MGEPLEDDLNPLESITEKEFWEAYDKAFEAIRWAILEYFGQEAIDDALKLREAKEYQKCLAFMNDVWFYLPDSRFNIVENPPGWHTFLSFLEDEAMKKIQ